MNPPVDKNGKPVGHKELMEMSIVERNKLLRKYRRGLELERLAKMQAKVEDTEIVYSPEFVKNWKIPSLEQKEKRGELSVKDFRNSIRENLNRCSRGSI